jgi:hypothetical protein
MICERVDAFVCGWVVGRWVELGGWVAAGEQGLGIFARHIMHLGPNTSLT